MAQIDLEQYKPPISLTVDSQYGLHLADVVDFAQTIDPKTIEQIGFTPMSNVRGRRGHWKVFERSNYPIPNFPEGETLINSALALYDGFRPSQHVILRTSTEQINPLDFNRNVADITRFYIERPDFPKFPMRFKDVPFLHALGSAGLGAVLSRGVLLLTESAQNQPDYVLWVASGFTVGALVPLGLLGINHVRQGFFKEKLPLHQYSVTNQALKMLDAEEEYAANSLLQREIYQALQQKKIDIQPRDFLYRVYATLEDHPLAEVRREELKAQRRHEEIEPESNARKRLIKAAIPLAAPLDT